MRGEKNVSVVIAGSGEIKELSIPKGTRARDILDQTGLTGYDLYRDGQKFMLEDDVYDAVKDGTKLQASTPAEVGKDGGEASRP